MLRVINEGTVEGLSQAKTPPTHDRLFYQNLRHSNEVFAAFKVHQMGEDMAAKLFDASGNIKSFDKWLRDVSSISSHQVGAWLRTEYDTAVIRAHAAADWQEFERNKDIFPNLRWMPTTSPEPESTHAAYWRMKLTLPVDDPFWNEHHPGDRWNCKCSLEATDEPVVRPAGLEPTLPQRGLENNPGKDGHTFSDKHPYFPSDCSHCFAYKKGGITNRLKALFLNREKDCYNCPFIDGCIDRPTAKLPVSTAANAVKQRILDNDQMPLSGDTSLQNLNTGELHLSRKSRKRFLKHAHHDYDAEAAMYAWNNPHKLKSPRVSPLGEGKNMSDPDVQANIQRKIDRHVMDYVEYKLDYGGRTFLVKLERMTFGKEQFYSIIEE